jgi:chemotaxis protein methyltransferase CheR
MVSSDDVSFNILKRKIWERTGLDCSKYKDSYLKRRIGVRLKANGLSSYWEYRKFLEKNPTEYDSLLDAIAINVSEFFRDVETFDAFKSAVLPQLLSEKKRRQSKILRIWSAGCSFGEEPYTIGIILKEVLGAELSNFLISIHATDFDENALRMAREGIYGASSLKNVDKVVLSKYFLAKEGDGKYQIKDDVKRLVKFKRHELISGKKFSYFDVIFCRNVMIYFSKELQSRLLLDFYDALNDGGYLILGRTEMMIGEAKEKFSCENIRERIYRKVKS